MGELLTGTQSLSEWMDILNRFMNTEYGIEVLRGNVSGQAGVGKFGRNSAAGTGEDIHDAGGTWVEPTADRIHDIASTSTADDLVGTGLQTLRIWGISGGALTTEDIDTDGTTNVPTVNAYSCIFRMKGLTWGSGLATVGTITATAQTDATVTATIVIGNEQTQMAVYQVPSGTKFYLTRYYAALNQGAGAGVGINVEVLAKEGGTGAWIVKHVTGGVLDGTSFIDHALDIPIELPALTYVKLRVAVSAGTPDVSAGFDAIVYDD